MKQILVLHTGGTISMEEDAQSGAVSPSSAHPLLDFSHQLKNLAHLITKQPFHLPSPHIEPTDMFKLKSIIEGEYRNSSIDGVVITHGTDTLEETAYFLDLTVEVKIPVVMTGAMRSSNEIGSDGLYNFISAVRVACTEEANGMGVLVVLNDEIHTAKNVTKTHASNVSTFQSPQYGPIGIVTKREILFHHKPLYVEKYQPNRLNKRVALLKAYAGMDSDLFTAIQQLKYDGVVIEALGQGNLPPHCLDGLKKLLQANIPVILVSRCYKGSAQDVYDYEGGGKQLKEMGVIFCNGLNGQKARIKLLIALTKTTHLAQLAQLFQHPNYITKSGER
ncbi:asparaginase [Lederbergia sp. NSJ-179]|uniref:asparaginase n=1 Tax=Lederbergia sp. NSJ-179 TaxID=2931402 RepID=UPI001FD16071|nr:asparaginase [Lederbergia sp. NSJ-179]MCJ7839440.1 asparaginase [Lederbergia sp. NSJ-179]